MKRRLLMCVCLLLTTPAWAVPLLGPDATVTGVASVIDATGNSVSPSYSLDAPAMPFPLTGSVQDGPSALGSVATSDASVSHNLPDVVQLSAVVEASAQPGESASADAVAFFSAAFTGSNQSQYLSLSLDRQFAQALGTEVVASLAYQILDDGGNLLAADALSFDAFSGGLALRSADFAFGAGLAGRLELQLSASTLSVGQGRGFQQVLAQASVLASPVLAVPEPAMLPTVLLGLGLLAWRRRPA